MKSQNSLPAQAGKLKTQNYSLKRKTLHSSPRRTGFTLVELLVVVTLLGLIGTIVTQVFILNTRSQGKGEILKEVKQNGDFIENAVESMVRNASDITSSYCNANSTTLTITNSDGYTTIFDCSDDANLSSTSAGADVNLNSSKVRVSGCNFRVVCPTPPLSPKYVFFSFSVCQSGGQTCPGETGLLPEARASIDYQTTVSLRNYQ